MSDHAITDGIIDVLTRLFARFACPGKLDHAPKNGVILHYNKRLIGMVKFEFVTKDNLHIGWEIHLPTQAEKGPAGIEELLYNVRGALAEARAERNKQHSSLLGINTPTPKPVAAAVNRALN